MARQTLTVRTPEDILALVPYVMGFVPANSLVLVTTGGPASSRASSSSFHARVDLPDDPADVPAVVETLVAAAVRNRVARAVVVVYTDDAALGRDASGQLRGRLERAGVTTALALRADGRRYFLVDAPDSVGTPYDVATHPLSVSAVVDGRVTHRTREELSRSLLPADPHHVTRLAEVCEEAACRLAARLRHPLGAPAPELLRATLVEEATWARQQLRAGQAGDGRMDDTDLARLLVALLSVDVRDVLWVEIHRGNAAEHVALWADVVRRAPLELAAAPAALLAFAAWQTGDGALAWCAVDRCREADPAYSMADLVASALEAALPPTTWRPVDPSCLPLLAG